MMSNLRNPFFFHIFKTRGRYHTEAHEEDVCLGIGERPKPVVILLASGIEEPEGVGFPANHDSHSIIVKHLSGKKH